MTMITRSIKNGISVSKSPVQVTTELTLKTRGQENELSLTWYNAFEDVHPNEAW